MLKKIMAKKKIFIPVLAVLLAVVLALGFYFYREATLVRFQDVTIELGSSLPDVSSFLTEHGDPDKAKLETPESAIDLTKVGVQTLQFSHGMFRGSAQLIIVDTTPPAVTLQDVTAASDARLRPEDFVVSVEDKSEVQLQFVQDLEYLERYGEVAVEILAEDVWGNASTVTGKVNYRWMRPEVTLELGEKLKRADVLIDFRKDYALVKQADLDQISNSSIGTYTLTSTKADAVLECVVTVQDTRGPEIKLQEVRRFVGETVKLEDFVVSATDFSGEVTLRLMTELKLDAVGNTTVVVEAEDIYGNVTSAETLLRVIEDTTPPEFFGVSDLYVEKHTNPSYTYGVSAVDSRDGEVAFSYDASRVDTGRAGTYYVIYTATDSEGNEGTFRRRVVVSHDAEDTAELVRTIAAGLSDDLERIRDHIRDHIWYSSNWGGDDPIWFGFNEKNGNCYVHALCLQAVLTEKGYENQLIWVTDKSHYWLIVKVDGVWRHIDATPGALHSRYSLMTDAQRYETLSGRNWDRTAWPACE